MLRGEDLYLITTVDGYFLKEGVIARPPKRIIRADADRI